LLDPAIELPVPEELDATLEVSLSMLELDANVPVILESSTFLTGVASFSSSSLIDSFKTLI
jgi:hypothetical protein